MLSGQDRAVFAELDLRDHGLRRINVPGFRPGVTSTRIGRPSTISGARVSRRRAAR
jgi:hypothetical protein